MREVPGEYSPDRHIIFEPTPVRTINDVIRWLYDIMGYDFEEISSELGMPPWKVRSAYRCNRNGSCKVTA